MRTLTLIVVLLAAAGCHTTPDVPDVPEQVEVIVEKMVPPPSWSTEPLPVAHRNSGAVSEHLRVEEANTGWLNVANCHRRLLRRLGAGETVDPKECQP